MSSGKGDKVYRDYLATLPPAQRQPGGQQQKKTSVIHDAPSRTGQRPAARTVAQPGTPPARRQRTGQPGAKQQPSRSRTQKGK